MHALHSANQSPLLLADASVHKAYLKPAADTAVEGLWQSQNLSSMPAVEKPAQNNLSLATLQAESVKVGPTLHAADNYEEQLQHSAAHLQHS